jgi:hypothetical protein
LLDAARQARLSAQLVGDDEEMGVRQMDYGHNGGPLLDDEDALPEWQVGDLYISYCWKKARKAAWKVSRDIALYRLERAEKLGLTYEEYTLEILERGRNLQPDDQDRIDAIKRARPLA